VVLEDNIADADDSCPVGIPPFPVKEEEMNQEDADSALSRCEEVTNASNSVPDAGSAEDFIPSLVPSPSASGTQNLKKKRRGRKTKIKGKSKESKFDAEVVNVVVVAPVNAAINRVCLEFSKSSVRRSIPS
jgi:hypothetical protein